MIVWLNDLVKLLMYKIKSVSPRIKDCAFLTNVCTFFGEFLVFHWQYFSESLEQRETRSPSLSSWETYREARIKDVCSSDCVVAIRHKLSLIVHRNYSTQTVAHT